MKKLTTILFKQIMHNFAATLVLVLMTGCSDNVISAILLDTGQMSDTATAVSTDSDSSIDSDTSSPFETDPGGHGTDTTSEDSDTISTDSDTYSKEAVFGIIGYATVNSLMQDGTTGGAGDPNPITVTTGLELQAAIDANGNEPRIIYVSGNITHPNSRILVSGKSNISIIGVGGSASLNGTGISLFTSINIIIQNLSIHQVALGDQDGIYISDRSHHVWIDHCEIYNDSAEPYSPTPYDSLLDISHASDYITVSWTHFHSHVKTIYVGHTDDNPLEDTGSLHVTFHHNKFSDITPIVLSMRFGTGHAFNNMFETIPHTTSYTEVGISSRMRACMRIENNLFAEVDEPIKTNQSGDTLDTLGSVQLINNELGNHTDSATIPACELAPPYEYQHILNAAGQLGELLNGTVGPGIQ